MSTTLRTIASPPTKPGRLPRLTHPIAWWVWALGMAAAAGQSANPVLLALVLAVCGLVVTARRTDAPWARAFGYYLVLGCSVIGIRVLFRIVFGGGVDAPDAHVLLRLPTVPLPHWAAGVRLGGAVSAESVLAALYDGMRLATLLCCVGAANALANPKRALRALPGALYELGVAVVIAVSVAPQLVQSVARVRRARLLRGGGGRRHLLRTVAVPVLQDALDRSLALAAAMDSRGYGRRAGTSAASRRLTGALLVGGLALLCIGVYGLLDATTPWLLRLPAMLAGATGCAAGLAVGSRRVHHTSYRPDRWHGAEWVVAGSGAVAGATLLVLARLDPAGLNPSGLDWPAVPVAAAAAILAGLLALAAPPPPRSAP